MSVNVRRALLALVAGLGMLAGGLACGSGSALAALQATYASQLSGFEGLEADSVAVDDASGDVFVANSGTHTIQEFDSLGVLLASWNGSNTPAGAFGGRLAVAVDDTTGRVYVTDKSEGVIDVFGATGTYLSQFNGKATPSGWFGSSGPQGAAIDQATGDLYVPDPSDDLIDVFDASGTYLSQFSARTRSRSNAPVSVAVDDPAGEILVAEGANEYESGAIYVYNMAGQQLATWTGSNAPTDGFGNQLTLAIDEATGDVLVATGRLRPREGSRVVEEGPSLIDVFDSSGDYLSPQITGTPEGPFAAGPTLAGITTDPATGDIYFSYENAVDIFHTAVLPGVIPGTPTSLPPGGARLAGMVNPDGIEVEECRFEYGTEAGTYPGTAACLPAHIGAGRAPQPVSAQVSGLQADTRYHFRLDAKNENGLNTGEDETFFTSTAPLVEAESSSSVDSTEAALHAQIDAAALSTTYRIEYGTSAAYGSSTPEVSVGDSESLAPLVVQLSALQPGVEYHYRFLATNSLGTTVGADATFTTLHSSAQSGLALPDGRAYELVTLPTEDRDTYAPLNSYAEDAGMLFTRFPMQASADGSALAYVADPAPGGSGSSGNGSGNEFIATRAPTGGWSSNVITPRAIHVYTGKYSGFSSDLSVGLLISAANQPVTSDASLQCMTLYSHTTADGSYHAIYTKTKAPGEPCSSPRFAGASLDGSHIAFEMPAALTPEAPGGEANNLYETVAGQLHLVDLLPNGTPAGSAKFGSPNSTLFNHVISADGSRLFWTDLANGNLYARVNSGTPAARSVLISEGGEYLDASSDGSLVIFTKGGSLLSFDIESEQTTELAHEAEVQGILGASEDRSYVYFVAKAALRAPGGEALQNDAGAAPVAGEDNLYLVHGASTQFIATLAAEDANDWISGEEEGSEDAPSATNRAEVAPDGRAVVFQSTRRLTGYENASATEVYVYQSEAGHLYCASCTPSGAPPVAGGGRLSLVTADTHLPRWINDEGSQVFFESAEPLVSQHSGGQRGVYEWERDGAGSCELPTGCVYLLSGAANNEQAVFIDASASGSDVFFVTRGRLLTEDEGDDALVYDARVGARSVATPLCTGTGCQGVPPAQPIFATPASVTFNGVGNFAPVVSQKTSTKKKTTSKKCPKGKRRSHGKCIKAKPTKHKSNKPSKRAKRSSRHSKKGRKS